MENIIKLYWEKNTSEARNKALNLVIDFFRKGKKDEATDAALAIICKEDYDDTRLYRDDELFIEAIQDYKIYKLIDEGKISEARRYVMELMDNKMDGRIFGRKFDLMFDALDDYRFQCRRDIRDLLKTSGTPNDIFIQAAMKGEVDTVRLLLKSVDVDPSANSNIAIRWASEEGHADVVKLLLKDERVNPFDYDNYAIRMALKNGHDGVTKLLSDET